jgi:putative redox protein
MATKTTTVHHLIDKRFVGITPEGQRVMIDGENHAQTGMRPMDLLLNAVGACAAYDIVEMLSKRRLTVHSYRIELEGTRHDGTPAYYTHIHARHIFNVPDLDEKTATRFVDLGMNKYCSVAASLKAEISFEVVLEHTQT